MRITDQAIKTALKDGGRIRRSWWSDDSYIYLNCGCIYAQDGNHVRLTFAHIEAEDWEVVGAVKKAEPSNELRTSRQIKAHNRINFVRENASKMTNIKMAEMLGICPSTIVALKRKAGVFVGKVRRETPEQKQGLTSEQITELRAMFDQGVSASVASNHFGITPMSIRAYFRKFRAEEKLSSLSKQDDQT